MTSLEIFAQGAYSLDNTGGTLKNNGTIKLYTGQVKALPDTIGGRFEFLEKRDGNSQSVPTIVFKQLVLKYIAKKFVDAIPLSNGNQIPLTTTDSLIVTDSVPFEADREGVDAKASVVNTSRITGSKDVRMNGDLSPQDIEGAGHFANLNIDNPNGVDIIRNGGFRINHKLELTQGELRNNTDSNFTMADSSWIIRHVGASLKNEPIFENHISVKYTGIGSVDTITGEIPSDTTKLLNLFVESTRGVTLTKNVVVNDTLYLKSPIRTEPDTSRKFVLTLTTLKDPVFDGADAEIDGSFRRTSLHFDSVRIIFNNPYTWALFKDSSKSGGMRELTFRVKPRTFPPIIGGDMKVERLFNISALDGNNNPVVDGVNMTLGYGWRASKTDTALDETKSLWPDFDFLILQRWYNAQWLDMVSSQRPTWDSLGNWAYSSSDSIFSLGVYGIGLSSNGGRLVVAASVFLEGPYRFGSMSEDLRLKNLLPATPPNIYPYNLDQNRPFINIPVMPDSVVDYLVLEFRKTLTDPKPFYRTCLLKMDGSIVDLDGKSPVLLAAGGISAGDYYLIVRHRNHLSIATENTVGIYPRSITTYVDFTDPNILLGRANAVKPIGKKPDGSILWGMIAGDVNHDGVIDSNDQILTWDDRDFEGYLTRDINLSGIINTRDLNYSWNNRGRTTLVP